MLPFIQLTMLAAKDNTKRTRRNRVPAAPANPGDYLELTHDNFHRICGLNGLFVSEVASLIERSKVQIYRALRNPEQNKPTIALLEELLPRRTMPSS